jgi:hypothetical protein
MIENEVGWASTPHHPPESSQSATNATSPRMPSLAVNDSTHVLGACVLLVIFKQYTRCLPLTLPLTLLTLLTLYSPFPPLTQTGKGIDTEQGAASYLESSGVHALLEELLTMALVAKPANPAAHLAHVLQERLEAKANGTAPKPFFTDDDLRGVHSLFDATHNNSITAQQARTALRSLGADASVVTGEGSLDAEAFIKVAREALGRQAKGAAAHA